MKIFHYTSIETLALILKNKTTRFSRLDRVDVPDEYSFKEDGITPAHYCFVSCWTKNCKENLPQWYMYGNSTHEIRIEMDSDMFELKVNKLMPTYFNEMFCRTNYFIRVFVHFVLPAALLLFIAFTMRVIYGVYCTKHFEECHYSFVVDKKC